MFNKVSSQDWDWADSTQCIAWMWLLLAEVVVATVHPAPPDERSEAVMNAQDQTTLVAVSLSSCQCVFIVMCPHNQCDFRFDLFFSFSYSFPVIFSF